MRNPEFLPNNQEMRPEVEPERDLCLKSLLAQAEGKMHSTYDREADQYLLEGLGQAEVEDDNLDDDEFKLVCQQPGCEANCVLIARGSGSEATVTVKNPQALEVCLLDE